MDEHEVPRAPLTEEAVRLVGAMQDWALRTFPPPADGHGGPECRWCPLCQFVAVLRGERPEVTARVAEAGTAIGSAIRALVDAASAGTQPTTESGASRVQHINLGEPDQ